jgi:hypothetical protein
LSAFVAIGMALNELGQNLFCSAFVSLRDVAGISSSVVMIAFHVERISFEFGRNSLEYARNWFNIVRIPFNMTNNLCISEIRVPTLQGLSSLALHVVNASIVAQFQSI